MGSTQSVTINGVAIKQPDLEIERYNVTKAGRVSSGKMMMDLIAKKRKFKCSYKVLSGPEFNAILALIDTDELFFTLGYKENGVSKTATVYTGAITSGKPRAEGIWYWPDVKFDLIEQ